MKHVKAQAVLPEEIIKIIQQYVDGEYIYIPKKDANIKAWGEKNGTRTSLKERNANIFYKFNTGATILELSNEYFLSEQSIRRILCEQRNLYSKAV